MTTALVRSELRKITSTRLWWGLLIGAVVYTVIQAAANAALAGSDPGAGQPATAALDTAEAIRTVYASSPFQGSYIFAMILGITGMTGEYRYQTITPTFLATPRRARVVLGKMAAHLLVGIGYGVVAVLVRAGRRRRGHRGPGLRPRVRRRPAVVLDPARRRSRWACGRCSASASGR